MLRFVLLLALTAQAQAQPPLADRLSGAKDSADRLRLLDAEPSAATPDLIRLLRTRADEALARYEYPRAISANLAALSVAERLNDTEQTARCYRALGLCVYRQGIMPEALAYYRQGLQIAQAAGHDAVAAELWRGISLCHHWMGELQQALDTGEEGLKLMRKLNDQSGVAAQIMNLGTTYEQLGQLSRAVDMYRQSLEICETIHDGATERRALKNLAVVYFQQGDDKLALTYMERAVGVKNVPPEEDRSVANTQNILGIIFTNLNRYADALNALDRGLELARKARDLKLESTLLSARSDTLQLQGDLQGSRRDLEFANDICERMHLYETQIYILVSLSNRCQELGDLESAARYAEQGVALARRTGSLSSAWRPLQAAGRIYRQLNRRPEAEKALRESIAIVETWNAHVAGSDNQGLRFFDKAGYPYYDLLLMKIEDGDFEAALQLAESLKARHLLDVATRGHARITQAMSDAEKQKEQTLSRDVARLNTALLGQPTPPPALKADFDRAARDFEAFRAELYTAHPELKVRRGEAPPLRLAEMQPLLPDAHTILIEYAIVDGAVAAFTVERGPSGAPSLSMLRVPIKHEQLDQRIDQFHQELAARSPGYRESAQSLYRLLLAPLRARLAGKTNVVIIPDGSLWNLPFHALVDENGRHIIERFAVSYAPSLTLLKESAHSQPVNQKLLAIGSPRGDLPNAAAEARELGRLYGAENSIVLTGSQATAAAWRARAPQSGILHMATHGVLNGSDPLYSYLELSGGVLEARDLLDLDLHASLAVLSACETARGGLRYGEGVVGIAWAMMVAGAPSVVVSQWKVDSSSTTELMLAFHRNLRTSGMKEKAAALRTAALQLLRQPEFRHPFYWAGFELLGDGY